MEADNLCQWLRNELAAVELMLCIPGSMFINKYVVITDFFLPDEVYYLILQHHHEWLLMLPPCWSSPLASRVQFDFHAKEAATLAIQLLGGMPEILLHWVSLTTMEAPPDEESVKVNTTTAMEPTADLDPAQAIIVDYLTEETSEPLNNNATNGELNIPPIKIVWNLPMVIKVVLSPCSCWSAHRTWWLIQLPFPCQATSPAN